MTQAVTNTLNNLEQMIKNDKIDGDTLQKEWFPTEIFNRKDFIFISHSHKDEALAIKLAGYLSKEFGICSFIDSCVWGYMNELNALLNNCDKTKRYSCHHCDCKEFSYNLSYVHMMLASALMEMIDKCECMFFLNTPSSININEKTESPWIYYELNIANTIRKQTRLPELVMESVMLFIASIEFTPNLKDMIKINKSKMEEWEKRYKTTEENAYEALYKVCGVKKQWKMKIYIKKLI